MSNAFFDQANAREREVVAAWKSRMVDRNLASNLPCHQCVALYIYDWGGTLEGIKPGAGWWDDGLSAYPLCEDHWREYAEKEKGE